MNIVKVKVKNINKFASVFGADCFLEWYPELLTTGIDVARIMDRYYIIKDGKVVNDTQFFSTADMKTLKIVK